MLQAETNYAATEIEDLGVVWAVPSFRAYLEGPEYLVRCDDRAHLSVLTHASPNARINRWRLQLSEHTYQIKHKPGTDLKVADALPRLPTKGLDGNEIPAAIPALAVTTRAAKALLAEEQEESPWGLVKMDDVIMEQARDSFCQERREELDELPQQDYKWNR